MNSHLEMQTTNNVSSKTPQKIVVLLTALTKGGKTTLAAALCSKEHRGKMRQLSNCRTEVTVDWVYDFTATNICLVSITLNYKAVFGTDQAELITCEKFNEILTSNDGKYLVDVFDFEPQYGLTSADLQDYVLKKSNYFAENCDEKSLAMIIKNRKSNRFLSRITVQIPPACEFLDFFEQRNVELVLRDTRGLMDIDPEEAEKLQSRTMYDLGLDHINAVLVLGTSAAFMDTVKWYKNAYQSAFESVPIFVMTRPDSVRTLYDMLYGIDTENVTLENVRDFLKSAKKAKEKGFRDFPDTYVQCYRLLEMFDIGTLSGSSFNYKYKVYDNEELRYVYPSSKSLLNDSVIDYDNPDYKLYELIVFENFKDIISKTLEHKKFVEAINNQIKSDFVNSLQNSNDIDMYPEYRKYSRSNVNDSILNGPILGPQNGIVTVSHGFISYLGAATSAVSSRIWIRQQASKYRFKGTLLNSDGSVMKQEMPQECRDNLIMMALFKLIEDNTDTNAVFQNYYFINRYLVRDAIKDIRNSNAIGDSLSNVAKKISKLI